MAKFCPNCGAQLRETSRFCISCGKPIEQNVNPTNNVSQQPVKQNNTAQSLQNVAIQQAVSAAQNTFLTSAPTQAGEFVIANFESSAIQTAMNAANMAAGAYGTVRSSVGSAGSDAKKSPIKIIVAILGAIVMAVIWIVQFILMNKGIDNPATKILNYLTFAKGGLNRGIMGLVGGTLGKATVATAFISLIGGGAGAIGSGIKGLFSGKNANGGQKGNILLLILGIIIAVLLYWFFSGNMALAGTMAAISGAIVAIKAIGARSGIIYNLVTRIFSKINNGTRIPGYGAANSLMRGLTAGFALAVLLAGVFTVIGIGK